MFSSMSPAWLFINWTHSGERKKAKTERGDIPLRGMHSTLKT